MILFGGLYLLLAAVEDDAGVEILLVEWLGASHASALLAGRAVTNSCKGVDKVGGCCPDVVDENLVELWYVGPEDVAADVAFFLGGVGHGGGRLWRREKIDDGSVIEEDDGSGWK